MSEYGAAAEFSISLPGKLVVELDKCAEEENTNRNELIYRATKMYIRERNNRLIREAMRRGYMEMAKINLAIASEAVQAEYEASHSVERLVSGG